MKTKFDHAAALARRLGYDGIAERLETEAESAAGETYRVAVTGEFKAGKSTLVNRVFLKTDLLFTDLMEATAVPTEIRYGDEPLLEIVPWAEPLPEAEAEWADDGTASGAVPPSGREGEPIRIPRPDAETLKKYTSAETPAGRERLARETARVRLTWPAPSLEGLVLVDTPGINTLNAAVLTTTYRILPEADLVLFVTGPKALSRAELSFLSGRVFRSGIGRTFVAVAVGPGDELSPAARDRLAAEIRGQLAGIGQDRVPVET
ncbi:MAG: dynamin family protein, partial [Desulfococcaceae bacterium]